MKFFKIAALALFISSLSLFSACGDKSDADKNIKPIVGDISPENAEKKADEILKEIDRL